MWLEYFSQYMEGILPAFLEKALWNYKIDLCVMGASYLAQATGDEKWNQYIKDNGKWLVKEDGSVANWEGAEHNIDKVSFGKSLRILRRQGGLRR